MLLFHRAREPLRPRLHPKALSLWRGQVPQKRVTGNDVRLMDLSAREAPKKNAPAPSASHRLQQRAWLPMSVESLKCRCAQSSGVLATRHENHLRQTSTESGNARKANEFWIECRPQFCSTLCAYLFAPRLKANPLYRLHQPDLEQACIMFQLEPLGSFVLSNPDSATCMHHPYIHNWGLGCSSQWPMVELNPIPFNLKI